jgi:hypothetical protein
MGTLRILSTNGHVQYSWDMARVAAGEQAALAALEEARHVFSAQLSTGAAAFLVEPGQLLERITRFDEDAQTIIIVSRDAEE